MSLQDTTPSLAGRIRHDLYTIIDHYDETLEPHQHGTTKLPTQAAKGTPIRYAPKALKEAPAPVSLHVLDARREAHRDLHFWARFIMGAVTDIDGNPIRTHIDGTNTPALAAFVAHWADRITTDHPDDADNLAQEAAKHARTLRRTAAMPEIGGDHDEFVIHAIGIGRCPVTVDQGACGTKVRAYADRALIKCHGCGTEDTVAWWMSQIAPEGADLATADSVIACVAARTLSTISHDQLRQWATRGHIQRHGKDTKGRTLYSTAAVLAWYTEGQQEDRLA